MTEPDTKPCGEYHPLPCGLDKDCPVPLEYTQFGGEDESQDAWDAYQESQNDDLEATGLDVPEGHECRTGFRVPGLFKMGLSDTGPDRE